MGVTTILMSPPCQPFTRVGNKKDINDARSNALVAICDLLDQLPTVKYILMENVKGFETSQMRNFYIESLGKASYEYQEFILSPIQIGVPNMRQRYYCLARKTLPFSFKTDTILGRLPGADDIIDTPAIETILDRDLLENEFLLSDDVLQRRALLLDIVYPTSQKSMCFTKAYTHYAEGTGSVLCPYDRTYLASVFDVISDMPLESPERLTELRKLRLRYFTPSEVSRLMSFPERFSFPKTTTKRQRYRLLGNSINIAVVSSLINLLYN